MFVWWTKKTKKTIASLQAVPSPSRASLDFPPFLQPATQAIYDLTTTKLQSDIIVDV